MRDLQSHAMEGAAARDGEDVARDKEGVAERLRRRGFCVVPKLFTEEECAQLLPHYRSQAALTDAKTPSLADASLTELVRERLSPLLPAAYVPSALAGFFFATERGVDHGWHRDHGTFFVNQSHANLVLAWIAVDKPDRRRSGLSVLPIDAVPRWEQLGLEHGGASRVEGGSSVLEDDQTGERHELGCVPDEAGVAPEAGTGDVVLLRGDVLHKTQDRETQRVALSMRISGTEARHEVTRRHWQQRSAVKRYYLLHAGQGAVQHMDDIFDQCPSMPFCDFARMLQERGVQL